ncbi:hypothetical protein [Blastomonas fulva]|uniref:hypothetical protein n=1 Tax=Blastomonas fulva TaxID=1550728 RepID=UPI003F7071B1
MATRQLYIAQSHALTDWAQGAGQLFLFKIGTTSEPKVRLNALNRGWRGKNPNGPCLGFTDWRWVERWHYGTHTVANRDEDRLKTFLKMKNWRTFDRTLSPRNNPKSFNGETEVFQIRLDQLPDMEEFTTPQGTKRNDLTDAMVLAAVSRHLRAELERIFPSVAHDDDNDNEPFAEPDIDEPDPDFLEEAEEAAQLEHDLLTDDLMSSQDQYARSEEDGWPYD